MRGAFVVLVRRDTGRTQRNRTVGRRAIIAGCAVVRAAIVGGTTRPVGIIRRWRRRGRRRLASRPARLVADRAWRAEILVGKAETRGAFAERGNFQGEV